MRTGVRIAITGVGGYVGSSLGHYLQEKGYDVYGTYMSNYPENVLSGDRLYRMDMTSVSQIDTVLDAIEPDVIIHTAALSNLTGCEKDKDLAVQVNVEATRNLLAWIQRTKPDIKLVFMSSDYVFDGERGNYKEDDEANPRTFYGKTKLISESDIRNQLDNYIICRTAGVYGGGGKFFEFIVKSLNEGQKVEVFDDVYYTPTYIGYLSDSVERLIAKDFRGVVHVAGPEKVSRYFFASEVAEVLCKDESLVRPVRQPSDVLISRDSSLNSEYVQKLLRNFCPTIEKSLQYCFGNLIGPYSYFVDERGKLIGITHNQIWKEINYIESVGSSSRGNHYHKKTIEGFYILDGCVKISLLNLENNSRKEFKVDPGDFFIIKPYTLHKFDIIKEAKWINMLSVAMNDSNKDIHTL